MIDEKGLNARVTEDISKFNKEIKKWMYTVDEERINASVKEDISKLGNEIERLTNIIKRSGIRLPRAAYAKEEKAGKDATLAFKIVDDHTYVDAIRIRTKWKGKNRLLWVKKSDLHEFLSHPNNFKERPGLFDSGKKPHETGGRIKLYGGTVWRWNACVVKKAGFFRFLFG